MGFAVLCTVIAFVGLMAFREQRRLPERLHQALLAQGWTLRIDGGVERGFLRLVARNVTLAPQSADRLTATVGRVELNGLGLGAPNIVFEDVHLILRGDPATLFEQVGRSFGPVPPNFVFRRVDVSYRHAVWSDLRLSDVRLSRGTEPQRAYSVRAGTVSLGSVHWSDVFLNIGKRKEMLEIGIGAGAPDGAPTNRLMVFDSNRKVASWLLDIGHQWARPLLARLAWDPGPAFDRTKLRVAVSLVVPFDETQPLEGNVQLTVDQWPKPAWPDGDALLGQSGSLFARLSAAPEGKVWELSAVQVTLPLFSLRGSGRVTLQGGPLLQVDAAGERSCALLRAHLQPSRYLEQVTAYVPRGGRTSDGNKADTEMPGLGLGLEAAVANWRGEGATVRWTLTPGCGISL